MGDNTITKRSATAWLKVPMPRIAKDIDPQTSPSIESEENGFFNQGK
jgi:hypothetical protein